MRPPSRRDVLRCVGSVAAVATVSTGVRSRSDSGDESDAIEWRRTYGDGDFQCHALRRTEGGVLVIGRTGSGRSATPWIAEVGSDGDSRWTTTIDTPGFTSAVDAVPVDGGYAVLGTTDESPSLWLSRLDGDGREQWRRRDEAPNGIRVLLSTGDGYLLAGYRGNPRRVDADLDAWVRALDTDGRSRWERTYNGSYVSDVVARGDGYLLAGGSDGDAWLLAIGPGGAPEWQHAYGGVGSESAGGVVPSAGGFCYGGIAGSITDADSRMMLVQTTADGEFVWRRTYDLLSIRGLTPLGDGFAVTGEPQNRDGSGRNPEKPIYVVDGWGRVRKSVTVSVDVGTPVGLTRVEDGGVVVGGWSGNDGIWLAKVRV